MSSPEHGDRPETTRKIISIDPEGYEALERLRALMGEHHGRMMSIDEIVMKAASLYRIRINEQGALYIDREAKEENEEW